MYLHIKKNITPIIYSTLLIVAILSCKKDDYNIADDYQLHCIMYEGKSPEIKIQKLLDVNSKYPFNVIYHDYQHYQTNTNVSNNKGDIFTEFTYETYETPDINTNEYPVAQRYVSYLTNPNIKPSTGETYEIKVNILNNNDQIIKELSSSTTIPIKVPFEIERFNSVSSEFQVGHKITFTDPANTNDFYYIVPIVIIPRNNIVDPDTINIDRLWRNFQYHHEDYDLINLLDWNSEWVGINFNAQKSDKTHFAEHYYGTLFTDQSFNGEKKEIILNCHQYDTSRFGTYLCIELYHISKEYYKYYESILKQINTQNDIYSEPVQVNSNIKNGHGLFGGASISRQIIEIKQE